MSERSWVDPTRFPYSKWTLGRYMHATLERLVADGHADGGDPSTRRVLEQLETMGWAQRTGDAFTPLAPAYEACGRTSMEGARIE